MPTRPPRPRWRTGDRFEFHITGQNQARRCPRSSANAVEALSHRHNPRALRSPAPLVFLQKPRNPDQAPIPVGDRVAARQPDFHHPGWESDCAGCSKCPASGIIRMKHTHRSTVRALADTRHIIVSEPCGTAAIWHMYRRLLAAGIVCGKIRCGKIPASPPAGRRPLRHGRAMVQVRRRSLPHVRPRSGDM